MKSYKKIDNLLEGYSKAEDKFTDSNSLINHIGDYMFSSKKKQKLISSLLIIWIPFFYLKTFQMIKELL